MPNYAQPFGTAGAVAGGATGAGLLGALGSALDTPRQALWNLIRKPVQAAESGDWTELLGAIPGAAGAVLGGLVGGPLGVLAGSALGGALQGAGKATGAEQFDAPEVSDLTGTDEFLPNMLVGALTDPLTYAGGFGGAARGRQAGQAFGKGLEEAAIARGPRYAGGAEKIDQALQGAALHPEAASATLAPYLKGRPDILQEIAPGSTYLGGGAESLVLKRPDGGVTMVRGPAAVGDLPPAPRLPIDEILPAERSRFFPGDTPVRVEHTQMANVPGFGRAAGEEMSDAVLRRGHMNAEVQAMKDSLQKQGYSFFDSHLGNVGFDREGGLRIIDPGAVYHPSLESFAGEATQQPTWLQNALLNLLGSDQAVQRELSAAVGGAKPPIPKNFYNQAKLNRLIDSMEKTPVLR